MGLYKMALYIHMLLFIAYCYLFDDYSFVGDVVV